MKAFPPAANAINSAKQVAALCAVGTTQLLAAPATGFVWLVRVNLTNNSAGLVDFTIQDSDGALANGQSLAAAGVAFGEFVSNKAVEIVVATNEVSLSLMAFQVPTPARYIVFKHTSAYQTVALDVPSGMIAVPWRMFDAFQAMMNPLNATTTGTNYLRQVCADSAAGQATFFRVTNGSSIILSSASQTKSAGLMNTVTFSCLANMFSASDVLELKLAGAPTIAGSYVLRLLFDFVAAA